MPNDLPDRQTFGPRILVIDADPAVAAGLRNAFAGANLHIEPVATAEAAMRRLAADEIDLITLDLDLPGAQGIDLLKTICRRTGKPIIVVTARPAKIAAVLSLELGADDYVMKPADPDELTARIRAVLRRQGSPRDATVLAESPQSYNTGQVEFAGFGFDTTGHTLLSPGREQVHITAAEAALLEYFLSNPRKALKRADINTHLHGRDTEFDDRSVDVLVKKLRDKIAIHAPELEVIRSKRGVGYVFTQAVIPAKE